MENSELESLYKSISENNESVNNDGCISLLEFMVDIKMISIEDIKKVDEALQKGIEHLVEMYEESMTLEQ